MKTLLLTLLLSAACFAADATGRWTGNADAVASDGEKRSVPLLFIFRMEGDKLTGNGGPEGDTMFPFTDVKLDNAKLSFKLNNGEVTATFDCVIEGDAMTGEAVAVQEGRKITAKLALKRSK